MALFALRDLQIGKTAESTIGTDQGGSFDGYHIRAANQPTLTAAQAMLEDPSVRQTLASGRAMIPGLKTGSKVAFNTFLRGTGTAAGNATRAICTGGESFILRHAFGAHSIGIGTTITSTDSTVSNLHVTSSAGMLVGQAVLVSGEASVIATVPDATHITLLRALSAIPAAATVVYASASYFPAETCLNTVQIQAIGAEDGYMRLLGCQGDLKLSNLNPGQIPEIAWEFAAAGWTSFGAVASLSSAVTYDNAVNAPVMGASSAVYVTASSGTTRTLIPVMGISVEPGLGNEALPSVSSTLGISGYARNKIEPVISLTTNPYAAAWLTAATAQTAQQIQIQIGSTAGQTVLLEAQMCYLQEIPQRAAYNSQCGITLKFKCRENASNSGALARSPFRLHLL